MADPISLAAVAGLIFVGRALSDKTEPAKVVQRIAEREQIEDTPVVRETVYEERTDFEPRVEVPRKEEVTSFADIGRQSRTGGQELLTMRDRMYDRGVMNNLSPIEKQMVGPGLGVGPETPAVGGYQQMFRVNPINVGEYRLTTLPGRTGPAMDITGGRSAVVGQLTHNMPEKTAYLPSRLPTMAGRAQGMSAAVPRSSHQKTMRTTNRSETGSRTDGLGFNGAKRITSALAIAQDPTRFKNDRNDEQYMYNNQPTPGIHSFHGAYTNSAAVQVTSKNNEELMKYGFRPEDRRGKANRMGNPGRMNVAQTRGSLTTVRSDTTRIDGRTNAANGAWTQQYQQKPFHQFNAYKGNENPYTRDLGVAKKQLYNNPLAHSLS
jgi:hypothetical protein